MSPPHSPPFTKIENDDEEEVEFESLAHDPQSKGRSHNKSVAVVLEPSFITP